MIEAMHITYMQDMRAVQQQAEMYNITADVLDECARIVQQVRADLDSIDNSAHTEIQNAVDSKGGWFGPLAVLGMIWQIVTRARGEAEAVAIGAAADI
ncbi:MAG: hypothetical protein ACRDU5_08680, partial [Mycobacterium sp.]